MASIQAGIQLVDRFTAPLMSIINSVNMAVSQMETLNNTMNTNIDTQAYEGIRNELSQATIAADELNEAMQNIQQANSRPEPVQQPFEWQSDGLQVFDTSGVQRYEQEIQSAEQMLNQLNTTQAQIAQQAAGTDVFSANAVQDINAMSQRIQAIQQRIQELESNPLDIDADRANNELENLRAQLNQAVGQQQQLNDAVRNMDVSAANQAYNQLSQTIGSTERYIRDSTTQQQNFNQTVENGVSGAKSLVAAFMGLSLVKSAVSIVKSQLDSAINRMDTMSNYSRTMTAITGSSDVATASLAKLKDMTKGTAYGLDVAASSVQNFVTRGMGTGDAVNQVKAWSDAVAFYGDGTNESLREVTDALGKMMTKGKVEMDQLDRLTDRGIDAVGIYAKATGQSSAVVQDNLSKGTISAQDFITTVSSAFENGTNGVLNISGAAKKAGDTWATSIANAKAAVTRGLISVIDSINEGLSNAGFGTILDGIKNIGSTAETVLNNIGNVVSGTITLIAPVANWLASIASSVINNWSSISPIVYGVAAALAAYCAAMAIVKTVELISTGIKMAMCVAEYAHAAATGTAVAATTAETAAQLGLNTALLACPITWIILLITALIGVLVAVAAHIAKTGGVAKSTFGVICGSFKVVVAVISNLFIGVSNTIISLVIELYNLFAKFANFIGNVFRNPVAAVAKLFSDLLDTIMAVAQSAAQAIDTILGTDMSGGISSLRGKFNNYIDGVVGKQEVYVKTLDASKYMIKRKNYSEAYKSGASFGDGVTNKVKGMFGGSKATSDMTKKDYNSILNKTRGTNDLQNNAAATAKNTAGTAKNTAKSAQALSATSEDLKYLRDMAAQRYINRFTTAKITVHQTNNNKISKKLDLDGVTEHLRKTMEEQMISAAEGVHI